ncbi:hypothetical protein BGZ94_008024 [Podila epigama]|nr:hypothetical protein BGZ94_008024 [Podila epigama]
MLTTIRCSASTLLASHRRSCISAGQRAYSNRSNGSAFLNNLEFLAPAAKSSSHSTKTTTGTAAVGHGPVSPSHPRAFQQSTPGLVGSSGSQGPRLSSNREFLKGQAEFRPDPFKSTFASKRATPASTSALFGSSLMDDLMKPRRRIVNNNNNNNNTNINDPTSDLNIEGGDLFLERNHRVSRTSSNVSKSNKHTFDGIDRYGNDHRPPQDRPRRNEEIDSQWIQYVSLEGNQGQKQLSHVLRTIDRSEYHLVEVDASARPPVCKLMSKKELFEKAKAAKAAKKANVLTKELQLNWGTDENDLKHKLARCRGFLEKGHRLDIQINGRRGRIVTSTERDVLFERVKAEFEPISKYVKQPEWVKATTVTMLLQGVAVKK